MSILNKKKLEDLLWGAAEYLRGQIDASDYKQYIFPLMFFKRISDVYDEEFETALAESEGDLEYAAFAENHHFLPVKQTNTWIILEKEWVIFPQVEMVDSWSSWREIIHLIPLVVLIIIKGFGNFPINSATS